MSDSTKPTSASGDRAAGAPASAQERDSTSPASSSGDGAPTRAQEPVPAKKTRDTAHRTDGDAQAQLSSLEQSDRLIHELRVHQIELEVQNRALREAQEELESSRERYIELFDDAPLAYLTLEVDGRITEANLTAARLLGQDRAVLIGRRLQTLVGMLDPLAFRSVLHSVSTRKAETRGELVFRTIQQQTHPRWIDAPRDQLRLQLPPLFHLR